MATDAQIAANQRNAAKSTGPKTEEGKAMARLNALRHGERAKTVKVDALPVLPQEDPRVLAERIQLWLDDWQPRDVTEDELVRRGAKVAWMLERGERIETAHLSDRVRKAARKAGPTAPVSAKRMQAVSNLGSKLFFDHSPANPSILFPPDDWKDEPAVFIAGLEETIEGCRWLLDRWAELRTLLDRQAAWMSADVHRFVRMLGKIGYEAAHDPALNALFLAWDVLAPGAAKALWASFGELVSYRDPAFKGFMEWRELASRPAD
jgi:hypothetical protein